MAEHVDSVVIGAGVVGLATAFALAAYGRDVIVLEAENSIGTGISSRNSEVIHAGIYYPTGSLKAQFCVRGKQLLYEYCAAHHVAYKRLGKLIVAVDAAEVETLSAIRAKAAENGVTDLEQLGVDEIADLEPELRVAGALLSPSTGIVDVHGLMLSLQGELEARGGVVAFGSPVLGGRVNDNSIAVDVGGATPMTLTCDRLVNAAGLDAQAIGRRLVGLPPETVPPSYLSRGNYFTLSGQAPFRRLIYPVPVPGGLGTHSTLDLGGRTKFGPDVEWIETRDYTVDPNRAENFYRAIRRYWPGLADGALIPDYAGIRPKLAGSDGGPWGTDFVIQGAATHGVNGLVNLYGIESPGLTSSLAIAEWVAAMI